MSIELVKREIAAFLARPDPEVLCIRGKWGVGKTYTWNEVLKAARERDAIRHADYSYVSLFGVNSLDELKFSIFENTIPIIKGVNKASLETLTALVEKRIGPWRKWTRLAQSVPIVRNVIGADATPLIAFLTVKDQIVCIDDLERRGANLNVRDVLGLISYLRQERNCKVALILNDEMLEGEDKINFEKNLEKVVDISLAYQPTTADVLRIGVPENDEVSREVAERCRLLGITNIRVIKRIMHFVNAIRPILSKYDAHVLKTAIASIALFCWSHDQPDEAPPIDFLRSRQPFNTEQKKDVTAKEAAWNALLDEYGYGATDDFDLELVRGISAGYFNPEEIKKRADSIQAKVTEAKAGASLQEAWRRLRESFADDQNDVLRGILEATKQNVKYVTVFDLNTTLSLFKELGQPATAKELLDYYMANRNEERSFYDLDDHPFGEQVTDPDIRAAFKQRFAQLEERRDVTTMLTSLKGNWSPQIISQLASLPVEEYCKTFKAASGDQLRRILDGVFEFDRISNASEEMREIPKRARDALRIIGAESGINRARVRRFGVKLDEHAKRDADA
jgi:hypothetical protein